jgi:hypothetical protein
VIIDLPQAVDAAGNNHAPRMLLRDVDNLRSFFGHRPLRPRPGAVDLSAVLREIEDARREAARDRPVLLDTPDSSRPEAVLGEGQLPEFLTRRADAIRICARASRHSGGFGASMPTCAFAPSLQARK